jgi:hypothetical protein
LVFLYYYKERIPITQYLIPTTKYPLPVTKYQKPCKSKKNRGAEGKKSGIKKEGPLSKALREFYSSSLFQAWNIFLEPYIAPAAIMMTNPLPTGAVPPGVGLPSYPCPDGGGGCGMLMLLKPRIKPKVRLRANILNLVFIVLTFSFNDLFIVNSSTCP